MAATRQFMRPGVSRKRRAGPRPDVKSLNLHVSRPNAFNTEALKRIYALYSIEEKIRGKPPDERRVDRQTHASPLLDPLHTWLGEMLATLSRKSDTSRAILYTLNRWEALTRYCDDGRIEIDNLPVERVLRGVAIGRRDYLFAGADSGGERAAAIYSLIGTAKLNGIDPERIYVTFSPASLSIRATASMNCCRGPSHPNCPSC